MTAEQLIEILKTLPKDSEIGIFWDGGVRGDVEGIVNDAEQGIIVIVGSWSIYRDGNYRAFSEDKIIFG